VEAIALPEGTVEAELGRGAESVGSAAFGSPLSDWILEIRESSLLSIVDCPALITDWVEKEGEKRKGSRALSASYRFVR
jgi:hypothetical protein